MTRRNSSAIIQMDPLYFQNNRKVFALTYQLQFYLLYKKNDQENIPPITVHCVVPQNKQRLLLSSGDLPHNGMFRPSSGQIHRSKKSRLTSAARDPFFDE